MIFIIPLKSYLLNLYPAAYCAREGQDCRCKGNVVYGKGIIWTPSKYSEDKIFCHDSEFGNPLLGVEKECRCTVSGTVSISSENLHSNYTLLN